MANNENDMIQIDIQADPATLKKLGEAAMSVAVQNGCAKLSEGIFLYDNSTLIEYQKSLPENDKGKSIDYTAAPFWVVICNEETKTSIASPLHDPMEVRHFLDKEKEPVTG